MKDGTPTRAVCILGKGLAIILIILGNFAGMLSGQIQGTVRGSPMS